MSIVWPADARSGADLPDLSLRAAVLEAVLPTYGRCISVSDFDPHFQEAPIERRDDIRTVRDVDAIVEDLEAIADVIDVERRPPDRDETRHLSVEIDCPAGTAAIEDPIRDDQLVIATAWVHPKGHLVVGLVPGSRGEIDV
jgi:hypothetical protein